MIDGHEIMMTSKRNNSRMFVQSISKMNALLFIVTFLCSSIGALGQVSIKGRISDQQQYLPSATVLLLDLDSTMIKGIVTDPEGAFVFEHVAPGHYFITVSMIGYVKASSQQISVADKDVILPDIFLTESVTTLSEVVVKEERQLFDQKVDRLVVNVQSSITSSGSTVLEVLQKSPGIVVNKQNNSISMNGKSGVRVMLNGKAMQLPLDVVVQMLDGMSASNVEKLELITSPPAEYEAEGNAGIIHIVTKANVETGTKGSAGLTLGARWAEALGANFNLSHRNKNFAYFVDYAISRNHNLHIMKMKRQSLNSEFVQMVTGYSHRENVTTQQNLSTGIEWNLSKNTALNVLFTGYKRDWDLRAVTTDINRVAIDSTVITEMNIHESNIWQSATGSIGLQTKVSAKSEIGFNVDYLYYHNSNPSQYNNNLFYEQGNLHDVSKINLDKTTPIRFLIAKADYQYNVSPSFIFEAGVKVVTSTLDNDVLVLRGVNNEWTTDPALTSYSTLDEQVGAGYISTKWQAGNQWQINTGLRYEYTHSSLSTPSQKDLIKRRYGYLFPSFSVKKNLNTETDLQFSYSRRLTRPTYNDIAPFVFFWGPNTFSAGNTALYPSIADAVTAGYHLKQWIISLQFTHARREIIFLQPEVDNQSNTFTYRSQNLNYLNTLGLTNSYSMSVAPWWEIQSNVTAQYQAAKTSHLPNNVMLYRFGLNINVVSLFTLPRDFSIEISGTYQSKSISGISEYLPLGSLNAGVQKSFGKKGTIRLSIDDVLGTTNWRIKTNSPDNNLNSYFDYDWHNRFIRLTYTWNLGNNTLRSVKLKSGSEEERGRISN